MAGIFISYRRTQEPSAFARLVSDRLGGAFPGAPIFLDVATIDAGHDWQAAIKKALADAETLLALIDEKWLTAADEHGRRRLDLPDDYVCFEIASALSAGKRVIPVLIGKASIPIPAALPTSIADLTKRQAMRLTHEGFDSEIGRLIETLGGDPTTSATVPAQSPQPPDLPHATNPYFTGRDEDLAQLHTSLRATGKAVRVQVVAAMGGVGKTTLANEYAHKHWQDYQQVLWVDARRGYEAEFALAFDRLFPERATADILPAAKAKAALAELNSPTDRLLVIDNAEDDKSVQPWLPHGATGCRTLITSRFTAWPKAAGVKVIDLGVLAPEKARDFLIDRTGRKDEAEECSTLARELGYLPLALEQAGAYIDEVSVGVVTYRRLQ
ncbi:MAG TPA: TIR domain-containing protein, partial [Reyranella sp.]